ncbi:14782_t:CDS:1, partial [Funneliformis geosporum]
VTYRIVCHNGKILETNNPQKMPNKDIKSVEELYISLDITTPEEHLGAISQLWKSRTTKPRVL